jgi:hypothetical protein
MRERIKILTVFMSIITLIFITSCFITKYIFGDSENKEWMQKWKGIINFDLKTERKIKEKFIIKFDPEWDYPPEIDPYEDYFIFIDLNILYKEFMDNYIMIELSSNDEIVYSNKINIFEPIEKSNFSVIKKENAINYKYIMGLHGIVNLEFDKIYQIKIEVFFDENLLEINELKFSINKRVL